MSYQNIEDVQEILEQISAKEWLAHSLGSWQWWMLRIERTGRARLYGMNSRRSKRVQPKLSGAQFIRSSTGRAASTARTWILRSLRIRHTHQVFLNGQ